MTENLDWVEITRGTPIDVRVVYDDGPSEIEGIKGAGFFGRFGESIRERLSIDTPNLIMKRRRNTKGDTTFA